MYYAWVKTMLSGPAEAPVVDGHTDPARPITYSSPLQPLPPVLWDFKHPLPCTLPWPWSQVQYYWLIYIKVSHLCWNIHLDTFHLRKWFDYINSVNVFNVYKLHSIYVRNMLKQYLFTHAEDMAHLTVRNMLGFRCYMFCCDISSSPGSFVLKR